MEEGEISDSDSEYGSSGAGEEEEEVSPASPLPQVLEVTTAPPSLIPLHRDSDNDDEVCLLTTNMTSTNNNPERLTNRTSSS
jgi:hypothetical protein